MARRTKSPAIALTRLADALGWKVHRDGRRCTLVRNGTRIDGRTTIRALGFLADEARRREDRYAVALATRWTGPVPTRGVKGWEAEALGWLCRWSASARS